MAVVGLCRFVRGSTSIQVFDIREMILKVTLSKHTIAVVPHLFKATELFMIMESCEGQTEQLLHQAFSFHMRNLLLSLAL